MATPRVVPWVAVVAGSLAAGVLLDRVFTPLTSRAGPVGSRDSAVAALANKLASIDADRSTSETGRSSVDGVNVEPDAERVDDDRAARFDAELRRRGSAGLATGWSSVRRDSLPADELVRGLAAFEALVATHPEALGVRLANQANEREAARKVGAAFELMARMEQGEAPDAALLHDADASDRGGGDPRFPRRLLPDVARSEP